MFDSILTRQNYSALIAHLFGAFYNGAATIVAATVYADGPIDRSLVVQSDDGLTELVSRDGTWFDSAGMTAGYASDKWLNYHWQVMVGLVD